MNNLQWVKASEKLPDEPDSPWNHIRLNGRKVNGNFYDLPFGKAFRVFHHDGDYDIPENEFGRLEWLSESPSSIEGGEKMFTKEDVQDAFDAGHDRGSYSAGGCDVMGVGYSPSFREWFEKEHPDKLSAKEIKDANESENWHPQDYSGRNKPPIPGDK